MKKLRINAAAVDMTKTTADTLAGYDEIRINCALALTTEATRLLLAKYPVTLNAASVVDVSAGCAIQTLNGDYDLGAQGEADGPMMLIANGTLRIGPDAKDALTRYEHAAVNGQLIAPENATGLERVTVNGETLRYPSDCELVDGDLVIDARFIRRAPDGGKYYVLGRVLMIEPGLDVAALMAKSLTLIANEAHMLAAYEEATDLLPARAKVALVPDGFAVSRDDLVVDEATALRFGARLCVIGNLHVPREAAGLADSFERIIVTGKLTLPDAAKGDWLPRAQSYGSLLIYKGQLIVDEAHLKLSRALLEACPDGLTFVDCAHVGIDPDIPVALLEARLYKLVGCASVTCSKEQLPMVMLRAQGCAYVGAEDGEGEGEDAGWVRVNTASYVL